MKAVICISAASTLIGYASAGLHQHIHEGFHHLRRYVVEDRKYPEFGGITAIERQPTSYASHRAVKHQAQQIFINIPASSSSSSSSSSLPSATSFLSIPLPSSSPPAPSPTVLPNAVPVISSVIIPPSGIPEPAPKPVENAPPKPAPNPFRKATPQPIAKPTATASYSSEPSALGSDGSQWCVTYSPYNADGSCKTQSSVSSDIAIIASKGFESVRLYSPDCSGLQNVGAAAKSHNLKLVLGIFVSENGLVDGKAQISEITSWAAGNWDDVEMIVVGNEAIFNDYCSVEDLAQFITNARTTFRKAGFQGPITTTEPISILSAHADLLCPTLDVIASNIHPFFNNAIAADKAGDFVAESLQAMEAICPGLVSYNLETGWPSAGLANGAAVPGPDEQKRAVEAIIKAAGGKSAILGFANDAWKAKGEFEVESHWGCSHLFQD